MPPTPEGPPMSVPKGAAKAAREFAKAVVRRRWADLLPLFAPAVRAGLTADRLADEFGWDRLEPRLRRMFAAMSGLPADGEPLDPPRRFEVFAEVEGRDPPAGHPPGVPVGWVNVLFLPAEESGFDVCYNLYLAFVDDGGPKVTAFAVEDASDG